MGKRRAKRAPVKKVLPKLDKTFTCPFCNHQGSLECILDREHDIGTIKCNICAVDYQVAINYLSEPIDVYSDFIDACKEAQEQGTSGISQDNPSFRKVPLEAESGEEP